MTRQMLTPTPISAYPEDGELLNDLLTVNRLTPDAMVEMHPDLFRTVRRPDLFLLSKQTTISLKSAELPILPRFLYTSALLVGSEMLGLNTGSAGLES